MLLPRARRGVEALRQVQEGFFIKSRLTGDDQIMLMKAKGEGREPVPLHAAAAQWLLLIRNSYHGFDGVPSERERDLLMNHDGSLPPDFSDLPWLLLIYLLAFPEVMRRYPQNRRGSSEQSLS